MFFTRKKTDFRALFLHGQRSVAEPGPTPSPWSIMLSFLLILPAEENFKSSKLSSQIIHPALQPINVQRGGLYFKNTVFMGIK